MTNSQPMPQGSAAQELIYTTVNGQPLALIFRPPTRQVFDRAPVYFLIPSGGWLQASSTSRACPLQFCANRASPW